MTTILAPRQDDKHNLSSCQRRDHLQTVTSHPSAGLSQLSTHQGDGDPGEEAGEQADAPHSQRG